MDQTKIGAFIAEMRKSQNLTQREFADRLGISNKTVSKWETGNGMPELSLMLPVCDILKIKSGGRTRFLNPMESRLNLSAQQWKMNAACQPTILIWFILSMESDGQLIWTKLSRASICI